MNLSIEKWKHILKYRILDIDTIAFILKNINVNAIVLGGSLDLRICVYLLLKNNLKNKEIIIIRDFEPHFVTLLINFNLEKRKFDLIVFDSNPDFEPNGLKWYYLLKDIINKFNCKFRIYMNIDRIQSDDISCKIFAINFALRLNKINYKTVKKLCKNNIISNPKIKEFKIFNLSSIFLKDTQSIKFLSKYFEHYTDEKLEKYIKKHSEQYNNKIMNKALDHKYINKYIPILQKYNNNNNLIESNKILYEYSGLSLINNLKIDNYVTKVPIFPNPKEFIYCEYLLPNRFKKIREYDIEYNTDYYIYRYNLIRYYKSRNFDIWNYSDFDINNLIKSLDNGVSQLLYSYVYTHNLII